MKEIELEVYCDEQFLDKERYIVIGCLFIQANKREEVINNLMNYRCLLKENQIWHKDEKSCPYYNNGCKKDWHELNNSIIHFSEIREGRTNQAVIKIAKKWLHLIIENNKNDRNYIFFNILYLDKKKLELKKFGSKDIDGNIYNRFFRTALKAGIKYFFSDFDKITIKGVYHHRGSMSSHKFFPELNLEKLKADLPENVIIENYIIKFLFGDHKKENDDRNQLIQYINLIIGSISYIIFYPTDNKAKREIATVIRDLAKRLLENPKNKNSQYKYYKRQQINFFPKEKIKNAPYILSINGDLLELHANQFYSNVKMTSSQG